MSGEIVKVERQAVDRRVFQLGDFILHSGQRSNWKIECDNLPDGDWECFASLIAERVQFGSVEGIPRGGLKLAQCLEKYKTTGPHLVVDDVWTDGTTKKERGHPLPNVQYWVVFSRGPLEPWCRALFPMEPAADPFDLVADYADRFPGGMQTARIVRRLKKIKHDTPIAIEALRAWEAAKERGKR